MQRLSWPDTIDSLPHLNSRLLLCESAKLHKPRVWEPCPTRLYSLNASTPSQGTDSSSRSEDVAGFLGKWYCWENLPSPFKSAPLGKVLPGSSSRAGSVPSHQRGRALPVPGHCRYLSRKRAYQVLSVTSPLFQEGLASASRSTKGPEFTAGKVPLETALLLPGQTCPQTPRLSLPEADLRCHGQTFCPCIHRWLRPPLPRLAPPPHPGPEDPTSLRHGLGQVVRLAKSGVYIVPSVTKEILEQLLSGFHPEELQT